MLQYSTPAREKHSRSTVGNARRRQRIEIKLKSFEPRVSPTFVFDLFKQALYYFNDGIAVFFTMSLVSITLILPLHIMSSRQNLKHFSFTSSARGTDRKQPS